MTALANLLLIAPLLVWGSMLLFPRRAFTLRLVVSPWPFVALGSLALLALVGQVATAGLPTLDLAALQRVLASPWGAVSALAQWQALTLFAGVWIFRDARFFALNPAIYLLATLISGPVGLALYLWVRRRHEGRGEVRTLN